MEQNRKKWNLPSMNFCFSSLDHRPCLLSAPPPGPETWLSESLLGFFWRFVYFLLLTEREFSLVAELLLLTEFLPVCKICAVSSWAYLFCLTSSPSGPYTGGCLFCWLGSWGQLLAMLILVDLFTSALINNQIAHLVSLRDRMLVGSQAQNLIVSNFKYFI